MDEVTEYGNQTSEFKTDSDFKEDEEEEELQGSARDERRQTSITFNDASSRTSRSSRSRHNIPMPVRGKSKFAGKKEQIKHTKKKIPTEELYLSSSSALETDKEVPQD